MKNELNKNQREKLLSELENTLNSINDLNFIIEENNKKGLINIAERFMVQVFILKNQLQFIKNCLSENTLLED
jgi:hypothetical protein